MPVLGQEPGFCPTAVPIVRDIPGIDPTLGGGDSEMQVCPEA